MLRNWFGIGQDRTLNCKLLYVLITEVIKSPVFRVPKCTRTIWITNVISPGPTEIRTRIAGFKVQRANHYWRNLPSNLIWKYTLLQDNVTYIAVIKLNWRICSYLVPYLKRNAVNNNFYYNQYFVTSCWQCSYFIDKESWLQKGVAPL